LCIMSLMDCRLYLMNCLQVYKKWKGKKKLLALWLGPWGH